MALDTVKSSPDLAYNIPFHVQIIGISRFSKGGGKLEVVKTLLAQTRHYIDLSVSNGMGHISGN